jgi:hypothetical protein
VLENYILFIESISEWRKKISNKRGFNFTNCRGSLWYFLIQSSSVVTTVYLIDTQWCSHRVDFDKFRQQSHLICCQWFCGVAFGDLRIFLLPVYLESLVVVCVSSFQYMFFFLVCYFVGPNRLGAEKVSLGNSHVLHLSNQAFSSAFLFWSFQREIVRFRISICPVIFRRFSRCLTFAVAN